MILYFGVEGNEEEGYEVIVSDRLFYNDSHTIKRRKTDFYEVEDTIKKWLNNPPEFKDE